MNIFTHIRMKWNAYWIWFKMKLYGDVRPEAVKPKSKPKKRTTKRTTK
jgi:hypothetical protein